ncbi:hypothetical protein ACW5XF_06185 [Aeromonas lusitana]
MDRLNGLCHLADPLFERTSDPQSRKCWISEHPSICFILCNGSPTRSFKEFITELINTKVAAGSSGNTVPYLTYLE